MSAPLFPQIGTTRVVDIGDIVRTRKHLEWGMKVTGAIASLALIAPFLDAGIGDVWLIGGFGLLAGAMAISMVRGWFSWLPSAAAGLLLGALVLSARAIVPRLPIEGPEDRVTTGTAGMAIAAAGYVCWLTWARFFAAARRSPFLRLVFLSDSRLGAEHAGAPLTWKARIRRLRPWALVIGALLYAISFAITMLLGRNVRNQSAVQKQVTNTIIGLGGPLFVWAKRRTALRGDALRDIDPRPPILLLRSFADDLMHIKGGARSSDRADLRREGMTFERVIEQQLTPFGPVVAIGRPREALAPLGAARDYVGDETWQGEVETRIRDASVVVLILGQSAGLTWEMSRVAALGQLHKLLVVFPPVDDLAARWSRSLDNDRQSGTPMLPPGIEPDRTLALIYADDMTPIVVTGPRDEWSYETALRIGGMLAITDGVVPNAV
jgi:hypothetical protein